MTSATSSASSSATSPTPSSAPTSAPPCASTSRASRSTSALLASALLACALAPHLTALASPAPARLLRERRAFVTALGHVEARVILQRGPDAPFAPLLGAERALQHSLSLLNPAPWAAHPTLRHGYPPLQPVTLSIHPDQELRLGDDALATKAIAHTDAAPELRLLTLAFAFSRLDRAARALKARLTPELLTLDRIDDRYVWALGDEHLALWIDRDSYRLARLELGPMILDPHHWTLRLRYDDHGVGLGWFPDRMIIERDRQPHITLHVTEVRR
jgi:hypothetical protein